MKYTWAIDEGFTLVVEPITYDDIAPFYSKAHYAGVSMRDTRNTLWLGGKIEGETVSIAALKQFGRRSEKARMKSAYTVAEWRGIGIGTALAETRLDWSLTLGIEHWEVFTDNPAFFLLRGFEHVSENKYVRTSQSEMPITLFDQLPTGPSLLEKET